MVDSTAARGIEKTASKKQGTSPGPRCGSRTTAPLFRVVAWPEVVGALQKDATRETVLGRYRGAGFTPDDFAHKRPARAAMANSVAIAEDALELASAATTRERSALRDLRRRLEWELWP